MSAHTRTHRARVNGKGISIPSDLSTNTTYRITDIFLHMCVCPQFLSARTHTHTHTHSIAQSTTCTTRWSQAASPARQWSPAVCRRDVLVVFRWPPSRQAWINSWKIEKNKAVASHKYCMYFIHMCDPRSCDGEDTPMRSRRHIRTCACMCVCVCVCVCVCAHDHLTIDNFFFLLRFSRAIRSSSSPFMPGVTSLRFLLDFRDFVTFLRGSITLEMMMMRVNRRR